MASIAVVDNDAHILDLLTDLLEERGWSVVTCQNGDEAVAFLKDARPDLVLLDLWLEAPTSGWRVLRHLRSEPQTRTVPVVLLAEHGDPVHPNDSWLKQLGVWVVTKPFDLDALYHSVEAALHRRVMTSAHA